MAKKAATKTIELPRGINKSDVVRPGGRGNDHYEKFRQQIAYGKDGGDYNPHEYELWYTERFGWVAPCLFISRSRNTHEDRYYATTVGCATNRVPYTAKECREQKKGQQCRVGRGPHILAKVTVYVRKSRLEKLQWLIDLYEAGKVDANNTRDRISTRRARGRSRRNLWNF